MRSARVSSYFGWSGLIQLPADAPKMLASFRVGCQLAADAARHAGHALRAQQPGWTHISVAGPL
jgi:hypothetical protein